MKKKILSLVLMLCLLITPLLLVSCDEEPASDPSGDVTPPAPKEPTAADLEKELSEAIAKVQALKEMDLKYVIDAEYVIDGSTIKMPITMVSKAKGLGGDNLITYAEVSMSSMGQNYDVINYTENGWDYTLTNGQGYKSQTDPDDPQDSSLEGFFTDLKGKDILKMDKLTYTDNADGSRTVKVEVDGEKFQEAFDEAMEIVDGLAQMGTDVEVAVKGATLEYTIKDGYVISYQMNYSMEMEIQGTAATCNIEVVSTVNNPGKAVTITPPEGYKNFVDITNSMG